MSATDLMAYPGPLARGAKGEAVERLQGWLALHGYDPGPVDGDFGPQTARAFDSFQSKRFGYEPGVLAGYEWADLVAPLAMAVEPLDLQATHYIGSGWRGRVKGVGDAVVAIARQWLAQRVGGGPLRELPGNSGPVVEHCTRWLAERDKLPCVCGHEARAHDTACAARYMDIAGTKTGCDCAAFSPDWRLPWCAGWVSTVLRQACESLGVPTPIAGSLSCDVLAQQAHMSLWTPGKMPAEDVAQRLRPGDLFLVRGAKPGDWVHCGVVLEVVRKMSACFLRTAEANTNEDGSRNGTLLLERSRGYSAKALEPNLRGLDFICWREP